MAVAFISCGVDCTSVRNFNISRLQSHPSILVDALGICLFHFSSSICSFYSALATRAHIRTAQLFVPGKYYIIIIIANKIIKSDTSNESSTRTSPTDKVNKINQNETVENSSNKINCSFFLLAERQFLVYRQWGESSCMKCLWCFDFFNFSRPFSRSNGIVFVYKNAIQDNFDEKTHPHFFSHIKWTPKGSICSWHPVYCANSNHKNIYAFFSGKKMNTAFMFLVLRLILFVYPSFRALKTIVSFIVVQENVTQGAIKKMNATISVIKSRVITAAGFEKKSR